MLPFIHLFTSPNGCYCYDVNTEGVIELTENLYNYLRAGNEIPEDISSIEELDSSDREMLRSLTGRGYLSDHRVSTIRHNHADDLEFQLTNRMNELILQVTQSCNLVCSYCPFANRTDGGFQRNHSSKKMEWETARKSIDLFLENSSEIDNVGIGFYGGEPFMNFPLIRQAVEYADKLFVGKNVEYSLTTNGTLMTDEIISYLKDHDFRVMFSIDGPESIHDINRRKADGSGSFRDAVSSLKKLWAAYGSRAKEKIRINTVINPETDFDEVTHLFDDPFFEESRIGIFPNLASSNKLENEIQSRSDFNEKFSYDRFRAMMSRLGLVKGIKLDPISDFMALRQIEKTEMISEGDGRLGDITAPGGPCIPGQRRLFVNADGNFYPCEKVNELSEDTMIGNINDGIDLVQAERLINISQLTEDACRECYAFRHCASCGVNSVGESRLTQESKLAHCPDIRKNFHNTLKLTALIREIDSVYKRKINI